MRPVGFISHQQKRAWLNALEAGLPPAEYLAEYRLRSLRQTVASWERLDVGIAASIDDDGDIVITVCDPERHFRFYSSILSSGRVLDNIEAPTPESVAAYVTESAAAAKQDRKLIRETGELLRDTLTTDFPRLAAVPLDLVPESNVNAWAQPVPAGGDVIAIHEHFNRCWIWSEWFGSRWLESIDSPLYSFPQKLDGPELASWRMKHSGVLDETRELARATMGIGKDARLVLEQHAKRLVRRDRGDVYAKMMSMIAVLHEYGHVALGHTDWLRERIDECLRGHDLSLDHAQMRKHEYAADAFAARAFVRLGANATKEGLRGRNHILAASAVFLFHLFHYGQEQKDDDDPDATHPGPLTRLGEFFRGAEMDGIENIV